MSSSLATGRRPTRASAAGFADSRLARRLRRLLRGDAHFDVAARVRYATDGSIYRVMPLGVVIPADETDVVATFELAREAGVPVIARGAGSSLAGQAIGEALILDHSRHLNRITQFDRTNRTLEVQPGVVLDQLNRWLQAHGLWFPVDVNSSAQATIGGMAGNNSSGPRSIRHGNMVHNVIGIDALLADGTTEFFGPFGTAASRPLSSARSAALVSRLFAIGQRDRAEIERLWPKLLRRIGGYNLDVFHPQSIRPYTADGSVNLAQLLVGSEGTLGWFRRITLRLQALPATRHLAIIHFASRDAALRCVSPIVAAGASAVEYLDHSIIASMRAVLTMDLPAARCADSLAAVRHALDGADVACAGKPPVALLVEFAGDDEATMQQEWAELTSIVADRAMASGARLSRQATIKPAQAQELAWLAYRNALHRALARGGAARPLPFIDDCAVPLADLADFANGVERILARHDARGVWSGPVSAGVLRIRPILKSGAPDPRAAATIRAIADETALLVRRYRGIFSGENGDGIVRSERINWQFGDRLERAFEDIKDVFDPGGMMNPGKIVRAPRMDDERLLRQPAARDAQPGTPALDWSPWTATPADDSGGFASAVAACDGNGHCRQFDAGVLCPSWRVTRDEKDLTRGRAHTLQHALTAGRRDPLAEAENAQAAYDALALCVGCKACRRECPAGVDMTRMKTEFLHGWNRTHKPAFRERLFAALPRRARQLARWRMLLHLRDVVPGLAWLGERWLGIAARRSLPRWRGDPFSKDRSDEDGVANAADGVPGVVLWTDTFNNWFEPDNLRAARTVLRAAGYRVHVARALAGQDLRRPLCCGRTFLSAGLVDEAREEARRTIAALAPWIDRDVPVIGLEPACLMTMRDEFLALGLGEAASRLARNAWLLEEFLAREQRAGRLALDLQAIDHDQALLHGHCHQKAFDAMPAIRTVLGWIPGLAVREIEGSCCGMAGAFGYDARHHDVSMKMAELTLLPAVRASSASTLIITNGFSCRHQIRDGAQRDAVHIATVLEKALVRPVRKPAAAGKPAAQGPTDAALAGQAPAGESRGRAPVGGGQPGRPDQDSSPPPSSPAR